MLKMLFTLLVSGFVLVGCTGTTITADQVAAAIKQACGIIVPIADIAVLITQANPIATTVDGLANAVCNAYRTQLQATPGVKEGTVVVNGVTIHYTTT